MTKRKRFRVTCVAAMAMLAVSAALQATTYRIEIDYMVGGSPNHSHVPSAAVINAVVQMFACQGHTLIVDVDDALTHYNILRRDPDGCDDCDAAFFSYDGEPASFGLLKSGNFDHAGDDPAWHYCIFAHQYEDSCCDTTTSSGLAEGSSDDFIVSLGAFSNDTGTLFDQAATLAHEFGHNIGLGHCGTMYCGSDEDDPDYVGPYVPNMPSVMSYRYQLTGVRTNMLANGLTFDLALFKDIDYSHGRMCGLNENSLNEVLGTLMVSTDFDCDGSLEVGPVVKDLNGGNSGWCSAVGNRTSIFDYNEWANIEDPLNGGGGGGGGIIEEAPIVYSCITAEEVAEVQEEIAPRGTGTQPPLSTESCISGQNMYIGPLFFVEAGTCTLPYDHVQQAHDVAPNNSRFYIRPGTYNQAPTITLDKPGYYFCNTGTAVIE
ncbi:MAG TPA: hypothetical protein VNT79_12005 [Phycisphaerae bacterium]|nr:hypothetical protein [Phycisphaerae bacterium]